MHSIHKTLFNRILQGKTDPRRHYAAILKLMRHSKKHLLNILSPSRCSYCKLLLPDYAVFCPPCEQKITPIVSSRITLSTTYTMTIFAVSAYKDPLRALILAKSRSDIVASRQLGELIWKHSAVKDAPVDILIPIPLHWTRFAYRGYNQADEIAQVLAQHMKKPVIHALTRTKRTAFQSTLTHAQRLENIKQAFTLLGHGSDYHNKHIILVDDLMTTSATLQAVAKLLIPHKPASISAVVACRVV